MTQERDIVDELREIQRMNTTLHGAQMAARAADEIENLRFERDELRCVVCLYEGAWRRVNNPLDEAHLHDRPDKIAKELGWDCFKENP